VRFDFTFNQKTAIIQAPIAEKYHELKKRTGGAGVTVAHEEELALQIDVAQWQWLRPHAERGALVLIDTMLELAVVGACFAADNSVQVQGWLASGLLVKPTAAQLDLWNSQPDKCFSMLVISPFVLIQERDD
jgi:hypothetical protein